jgi:hypothetical protein
MKVHPVEPAICNCVEYNTTNAVESAGVQCGIVRVHSGSTHVHISKVQGYLAEKSAL